MRHAENLDAAGIDVGEIQQPLDAGRLAGTVHAHQPEELASIHLQIEAVEHLQA